MSKRGFTLLELMVVVLVIGILAGLILSASLSMVQTGRKRRAAVEALTLENAIKAYRVEYGRWPVDSMYYDDNATNSSTIWFRAGDEEDDPGADEDENYCGGTGEIFKYLAADSDDDEYNPRRILFLETETFALDDDNNNPDILTPWGAAGWFIDENEYKNYYKIEIDLEYPSSGGDGVSITYAIGT